MGTTLPVRRAPRSLLFVAALLGSAAACTTDADCHLNGACVGGACACSPGWSDAACGTLMLAPLDPANGFNHLFESDGNVSTTWGGRALPGDGDGKFHAFFAFMLNHCSIANYSSNSVCMHGVGDLALGPFAVGDIVLGAFCHNPMIERGPNGEWLLFHIGSGGRTPVDCGRGAARAGGAGGSSSTEGAARGGGASAPGGWADVHVMSASSPYGPWTSTPDIIRNGADGEWDSGGVTNPAPLRLPNGSFLLGYRGRNATGGERLGIASAPSWRGPYTKLTTGPITAVNSEDPFLWMVRGWRVWPPQPRRDGVERRRWRGVCWPPAHVDGGSRRMPRD